MDFTEWTNQSGASPEGLPNGEPAKPERIEPLRSQEDISLPPPDASVIGESKDDSKRRQRTISPSNPRHHGVKRGERTRKAATGGARSSREPKAREKTTSLRRDREHSHRSHPQYRHRDRDKAEKERGGHEKHQPAEMERDSPGLSLPVEAVAPVPPQIETPKLARRDSVSERSAREVCAICLSPFEDKMRLDCGHSFCTKCILMWLATKPNCPTCRFTLGPREILKAVPNANLQGATPRDFTLLPHLGPAIGSPNTVYVWCVCWRRLVIADAGITQCACGRQIDPQTLRAYNRLVLEGEYPVYMRESCGPDTAECCGCHSYKYQATRAGYTGFWSAVAMLCMLGPTTGLCAVGQCCYQNVCATKLGICLVATGGASVLAAALLGIIACAECCCFADRTGRHRRCHPRPWDRDSCCLFCCNRTDNPLCCVARDCLIRCCVCERQRMRQIWVVPPEWEQ